MSFIRGGSGTGPGSKFGTEWVIDSIRGSQRTSLSPWDHSDINGNLFGFYAVAQASGATVSLGAAAHMASIRNASTTTLLVPIRIKASWTVTAQVTAATPMDLQAVIARGFTVDFTTNSTAANMSAVTNTNKFRSTMAVSTQGVNGPRIATTAAMSGQTLTADANPFNMISWTSKVSVDQSGAGANLINGLGVGGHAQTLYELTPGYQHPIILGANEGILIQPVTAGPTTGSVKYYITWEWAELPSF